MTKIYLDPVVFQLLDDMETNLRAVIAGRNVPDCMLPDLRVTLASLQMAMEDTVPEVLPTWPAQSPDPKGAA